MYNKVKLVSGILMAGLSFLIAMFIIATDSHVTPMAVRRVLIVLAVIFVKGIENIIFVLTKGGSEEIASSIHNNINGTHVTEFTDDNMVQRSSSYGNDGFRDGNPYIYHDSANPYASYEANTANSGGHTYGHFKNGEKLPLHDARGNNICPACGKIYPMMVDECPDCGLPRQDREDNSKDIY